MPILFDRDKLKNGDWLHVRGTSFMAHFIWRGQARMFKRFCKKHKLEYKAPWGNHDGLIIRHTVTGVWCVGEALGKGNYLTPLEDYELSINADKEEVKVYRVIEATEEDRDNAASNWVRHIMGKSYDFVGLFYLALKSYFSFLPGVLELEWQWWCTEGAHEAWIYEPPGKNLFNQPHAIPLHVEQAAGQLPVKPGRKLVLEDVTDKVMKVNDE